MKITTIIERVNQMSLEGGYEFGRLQELRSSFYQQRLSQRAPFRIARYFEKEKYAFHWGGQKKLQFNFGEDEDPDSGQPVFRYGLAFSFEPSRSATAEELVPTLKARVRRFNKFLKAYPEYLEKFRYWHWYNNQEFSGYYSVEKIGPTVQKPGYFLFIGNYLPKSASKVNDEDLQNMIEAFEYFMPVYRFVQLDDANPFPETRIARICWNTNGWVRPSGRAGKSKSSNSHEAKHGFWYTTGSVKGFWIISKS